MSAPVMNDRGRDPLAGDFLVVLLWDGTGLRIHAKRLERGRLAGLWGAPSSTVTPLRLTMSDLHPFLGGSGTKSG